MSEEFEIAIPAVLAAKVEKVMAEKSCGASEAFSFLVEKVSTPRAGVAGVEKNFF